VGALIMLVIPGCGGAVRTPSRVAGRRRLRRRRGPADAGPYCREACIEAMVGITEQLAALAPPELRDS